MTNAEATDKATTVAEQGAQVAPEKAASKKAASQKKGAPKANKGAKQAAKQAKAAPKKQANGKVASKKATKGKEAKVPREFSKDWWNSRWAVFLGYRTVSLHRSSFWPKEENPGGDARLLELRRFGVWSAITGRRYRSGHVFVYVP